MVSAPLRLTSLISSLGLPADKLSSSIVLFARFFSLPLKPELMAAIRRQVITQQSAESPQPEPAKQTPVEKNSSSAVMTKNREALSLAAAAAESKGVALQPKALEFFAKAVDPEWQRQQDSGGQKREQRNKNQNDQNEEKSLFKFGAVNASTLEKMALENAGNNSLLSLLNKLPGKDGQRWIVMPFDFINGDREFRVSMRVLIEPEHGVKYTVSNHSVFMTLDIVETGESENRLSFALEAANNKAIKLTVYVQSDLLPKDQSSFKRELSQLLNIPLERVSVINCLESFPFESGYGDELFCSINEAV